MGQRHQPHLVRNADSQILPDLQHCNLIVTEVPSDPCAHESKKFRVCRAQAVGCSWKAGSLFLSAVWLGRPSRTLNSCYYGDSWRSDEKPWKTDQYLEKLLPLALLLLRVSAIWLFTEPCRARLPRQTASWGPEWLLWLWLVVSGPGLRSRAWHHEPKELRNASREPVGRPLNCFSSITLHFRTDPPMWSERAPGEWERSRGCYITVEPKLQLAK